MTAPAPASTDTPSVIVALARVRHDLPGISKADRSDQGYTYRGIESLTREVGPLLGKHGVVITPHVRSWTETELTINNRPWTDQRLEVEYTIYGPAGDSITVGPIIGIGRDNSDKGGNKALTQAYKYLLLQVLCVGDASDDTDRTAANERDPLSSRDYWRTLGWPDGKDEHDAAWAACRTADESSGVPVEQRRQLWQAGGYRLPLSRDLLEQWRDTITAAAAAVSVEAPTVDA